MNRSIFFQATMLGCWLIGVFIPMQGYTQCSLVCDPSVQVSLDVNCLAQVTPDDILEGSNTCVGPLVVEIYDLSGNLIPTNPFVDGTYLGQVLPVKVIDQATGNFCESFIDIRDKLKPVINCSNINLMCNDATHPDDIGYAVVTDNCDSNPSLSFSDQISDPDCDPTGVQIITRTWTAEDASGNTAIPCVQTITLNRPALGTIQFPNNRDDLEDPSLDCVNPDLNPSNTGYPTLNGFDLVDGTVCEWWVMYTDSDPLPICEGSYSIIRTWTVSDECTSNSVSDIQFIKVKDSQGPVIDCPSDITLSATQTTCSGFAFILPAVVSDNCSSNSNINVAITDASGASVNVNSTVFLPVGIHPFTYTATDDCGNSNNCIFNVTIDDGVNPVVICNSSTTVALGSAGTTLVAASTFDDGSYDNCGPITFLARRMDNLDCPGDDSTPFNTQVPFYCCDVGTTVMVEMMVEDAINRLSNSCMVEVVVQDKLNPSIICPPDKVLACSVYDVSPSVTGEPVVSDNCGVADVTYVDSTDLNMCNEGMIFRRWTVTDLQGRIAVCEQKITLEDTIPAVITFPPSNYDAQCGDADDPSITGEPEIDDACGMFATNYDDDILFFDEGCVRKVVRVWTVFDWCKDTSYVGVQVIKEFDTEPPVFSTIPMDATVECDNIPPMDNVTAMDVCGNGDMVVATESITPGACLDEYTIFRKWVVEDDCGNRDSIEQEITVVDTTDPVITGESPDTIIDCDALIPDAILTASDNCDMDVDFVMTEDMVNGSCANEFMIVRTWIATDNCGNTTQRIQNISVQDTVNPILSTTPMDMTVECDMIPSPPTITATDNCDTNVSVMFDESIQSGGCADNFIITRTWTATDDCGNQTVANQTIEVDDTTDPVLSGVPADITVDCGEIPAAPMVTATDNCDNDVTVIFDEMIVNGACSEDITVTRTWTATDNCGNTVTAQQVITSMDDEDPVLSGVPLDMTVLCGNIPAAPVVTATDNCDNDVAVIFDEMIDNGVCSENITVTRTWTATDDCGNTATAQQVITSMDDEAPTLSAVPADMTVQCDAVPQPPTVTAMDNCDDMVDLEFDETITEQNCIDEYDILWTWTATDNCGNTNSVSMTIVVIDDTAPILFGVPANITLECTMVPEPPMPTATDNCDTDPEILFDEVITDPACDDSYQIFRTWTAVDNCENQSIRTQIITLFDTSAPNFTNTLGDITVECDNIPPAGGVTAEDECDNGVTITSTEEIIAGPCTGNYTLNRTYNATDDCGNVNSFTQMISVIDTTAPTIVCPADMTLDIQSVGICERVASLFPAVFDNCDNALVVSYEIDFGNDGGIDSIGGLLDAPFLLISFPIGDHTVTFTVTDDCGNSSSCSTMVQVNDLVPPAFFCNPQTVTLDFLDSTAFILPPAFLLDPFLECCLDTLLFGDLDDPTIMVDTLFVDYDDYLESLANGGLSIQIFAIDCYGNVSSCMTKIFILFPMAPPGYTSVMGEIYTEENEMLSEIEVNIDGGMSDFTSTNLTGHYEFMEVPQGYSYYVEPFNNLDPMNGVTTWDIIILQRHILEIQLLDSPYKMIAADVNRSGHISTFDIIELRKLILGIIPQFQTNTSWRFIDVNHVFPNSDDPFDSPFPEFCTVENLSQGINDLDFIGVKIGDLNNTAETNIQSGNDDRTASVFSFETEDQLLREGELISVPITANNFKDVLGFQYSLQYDPASLEFSGIESSILPGFDTGNFGLTFSERGLLTCSWYYIDEYSAKPDDVLFELTFTAKESGRLSRFLNLNSKYTKAEIYRAAKETQTLDLKYKESSNTSFSFELFQNRPNPFKEETIIGFSLKKDSEATLSIFNASGELIWEQKENYIKGYHERAISKSDLEGSGVYFYQLKTPDGMANKKMVLVK